MTNRTRSLFSLPSSSGPVHLAALPRNRRCRRPQSRRYRCRPCPCRSRACSTPSAVILVHGALAAHGRARPIRGAPAARPVCGAPAAHRKGHRREQKGHQRAGGGGSCRGSYGRIHGRGRYGGRRPWRDPWRAASALWRVAPEWARRPAAPPRPLLLRTREPKGGREGAREVGWGGVGWGFEPTGMGSRKDLSAQPNIRVQVGLC